MIGNIYPVLTVNFTEHNGGKSHNMVRFLRTENFNILMFMGGFPCHRISDAILLGLNNIL